jgi:hypothetical protein
LESGAADHAGVGDTDIDLPEVGDRRIDEGLHGVGAGHIGVGRYRLTASIDERLGDVGGRVGGDVGDGDTRAACDEGFGDALSDASTGAGDDRGFALELAGHWIGH